MKKQDIAKLAAIGRLRGLSPAEAEDAAQDALVSAIENGAADRLAYARQTVRHLAYSILTRRRRTEEVSEDLSADPAMEPETAASIRAQDADEVRQIEAIDASIEQIAFWGRGGETHRGGGSERDPDEILLEFTFYQEVLRRLPGYSERHLRRKIEQFENQIRVVTHRLRKSTVVGNRGPGTPRETPSDSDSLPKAGPALPLPMDIANYVFATRLDITRAEVQTAEGRQILGPMTLLWYGDWDQLYGREVPASELRHIPRPGPMEYRCLAAAHGGPHCVLGDLLWRALELARRLGPKATDQQALQTVCEACRRTYGDGSSVHGQGGRR